MALYFPLTSALNKLYVRKMGTDQMFALIQGSRDTFAVLTLARAEIFSAIRRRQREGLLGREDTEATLGRIRRHPQGRSTSQVVGDALVESACNLVSRHSLRAYEAMRLAGCLIAAGNMPQRVTFVCSDGELLEDAGGEGLPVMDPAAST